MTCAFRQGHRLFVAVLWAALLPLGCTDDDDSPLDVAGDVPDAEADVSPDATDVEGGSDADAEVAPEGDNGGDGGGDDDGGEVVTPIDCAAFEEAITEEGLRVHLEALEAIALAHGGSRGPGGDGWVASRDYVRDQLEAAGYEVTATPFEFPYWVETGTHVLERVTPTAESYAYTDAIDTPGDFSIMDLSPPGDVTAPVAAVDLMLGLGNTSTSGCEPEDFVGFPAGAIALVQRGTCRYMVKARNADAAGAAAVLVFNQGDTEARRDTLIDMVLRDEVPHVADHGVSIPVLTASYAVGEEIATLLESGSVTMHFRVSTLFEILEAETLTTRTTEGNPDELVLFGAHLDSWIGQPGINGDGTGIAGVLEIARAMASCPPARRVGFALWGVSYQHDLWGSIAYLAGMSPEDRARIYGYFDLEMLGSPNWSIFVHDGDGSDFGVAGPPRSADFERFFVDDMLARGYRSVGDLNRRNDTYSFLVNDIPTAALTTAAPHKKTAEEVEWFGGTEGEDHDPCFLTTCDTVDDLAMDVTVMLARSFARAAQFFGIDGHDVPPP
jgi:Zn-dependent M28 family amino/carboxypeptidase